MKKIPVVLSFFEEGDRVITPEGEGTVLESENIFAFHSEKDLRERKDIKILLDEPTSKFPNREAVISYNYCRILP